MKIFIVIFCALILISPVYGSDKGDVERLIKQGLRLRNVNKFEASEAKYLEAISMEPKSFEAHFQLGLLYEAAFYNKVKSRDEFQLAESYMPLDTVYELYFQLGQSYHYFEDYDRAITYYNLFKSGIEQEEGLIGVNVDKRMEECEFAKTYQTHLLDGTVKNLGENINSVFAEYVPIYIVRDSSLLYTRRGLDNLGDYYWDNLYYEDMYISQKSNGSFVRSKSFGKSSDYTSYLKNSKEHESVVEINASEDTLILYQENMLWYSVFEKGKWQEPIKFGKNINIGKYQRHGCLNTAGNEIIFSSNSDIGLGGYDLFTSIKQPDGTWSESTSLKGSVNTDKDEDSPFLSQDGKRLYFASKGHNGMGGYDIFYSDKIGDVWSEPINLGTPINSPANDIYFKKNRKDDEIYISSNRKNGFGNMDIYTFVPYGMPQFKNCDVAINGLYEVEMDAESSVDPLGAPVDYIWDMGDGQKEYGKKIKHYYLRPDTYLIELSVIDVASGVIIEDQDLVTVEGEKLPLTVGKDSLHIEAYYPDTVQLGESGYINSKYCQLNEGEITHLFWKTKGEEFIQADSLKVDFDQLGIDTVYLEVIGRLENGEEVHYCATKTINVLSKEDFLATVEQLGGTNIDIGSNLNDSSIIALPLGNSFNLENIYFNFDKFNIRKDARKTLEANLKVLKENSNLVINVAGHTDAMGSNDYNQRLSERRAKAAVAFLVKKGISIDQIKATLYEGEEDPAAPNINADGSDNSNGRQLNRRVEFLVVGTLKQ
ncbi:MAG: outer membrane protein OmpA-like peptidoglycan-associated protein [Flavobacteriales bacterium]